MLALKFCFILYLFVLFDCSNASTESDASVSEPLLRKNNWWYQLRRSLSDFLRRPVETTKPQKNNKSPEERDERAERIESALEIGREGTQHRKLYIIFPAHFCMYTYTLSWLKIEQH